MYTDILKVVSAEDEVRTDFLAQGVRLRWSFKFYLTLKQRKYELFSASDDERTLWIFVFNWIINENERI